MTQNQIYKYLMRARLWVYAFYCTEDQRVQRRAYALEQIRRNTLWLNALLGVTSTNWDKTTEVPHGGQALFLCSHGHFLMGSVISTYFNRVQIHQPKNGISSGKDTFCPLCPSFFLYL